MAALMTLGALTMLAPLFSGGGKPTQAARPVLPGSGRRSPLGRIVYREQASFRRPGRDAGSGASRRSTLRRGRTGPRAGLTHVPTGWTTTSAAIRAGGLERGYLVIRPPGTVTGPLPVVVVLAGRTLDPDEIERITRLIPVIGKAIMVYPAGFDRSWNAGGCCGAAHADRVDDVAFLDDLVHHVLTTEAGASAKQVYLIGFSNGGRMAYRLACASPDRFAGVAAVEAVPVYRCSKLDPVPMAIVAQSGDPLLTVPATGKPKEVEGYREPTVAETVERWRSLEGCPAQPSVRRVGRARITTYDHCRGGARLDYVLYAGGGHDWPEGDATTPSAGELIWAFLHRPGHPVLVHAGSHARHRFT